MDWFMIIPSDECHKILLPTIQHWFRTSGNGLVPSGNKPLPEPMLTQICVAIWHLYAKMSCQVAMLPLSLSLALFCHWEVGLYIEIHPDLKHWPVLGEASGSWGSREAGCGEPGHVSEPTQPGGQAAQQSQPVYAQGRGGQPRTGGIHAREDPCHPCECAGDRGPRAVFISRIGR